MLGSFSCKGAVTHSVCSNCEENYGGYRKNKRKMTLGQEELQAKSREQNQIVQNQESHWNDNSNISGSEFKAALGSSAVES